MSDFQTRRTMMVDTQVRPSDVTKYPIIDAMLTVPREALPPLGDDEFYHTDLIGLPVVTTEGIAIGTVVDIANYGATDIVEIAKDPVPEKGPKTKMLTSSMPRISGGSDRQNTMIARATG